MMVARRSHAGFEHEKPMGPNNASAACTLKVHATARVAPGTALGLPSSKRPTCAAKSSSRISPQYICRQTLMVHSDMLSSSGTMYEKYGLPPKTNAMYANFDSGVHSGGAAIGMVGSATGVALRFTDAGANGRKVMTSPLGRALGPWRLGWAGLGP